MKTPVREVARSKWRGILETLGIDRSHLTNKHGPCPICRDGSDRFRWDNRDGAGTWICSKCGAGDGIKLLMEVHGWEFKKAAEEVERVVGEVSAEPVQRRRTSQENRDAMNRLWTQGAHVKHDDPVGRYLAVRGIRLKEFPKDLRCVRRAPFNGEPTTWHPVMLALVRDMKGQPVNLHRTYLTDEGDKAPVDNPRKMMPGALPKGAAVRLSGYGETLGIAEGIETALSASILFDVPCWSAINAVTLSSWWPPQGVREVKIFADNDASLTGQAMAYGLGHRLRAKGIEAEVVMCPNVNEDWNDVLMFQTFRESVLVKN